MNIGGDFRLVLLIFLLNKKYSRIRNGIPTILIVTINIKRITLFIGIIPLDRTSFKESLKERPKIGPKRVNSIDSNFIIPTNSLF
jgi:hypothetical protein